MAADIADVMAGIATALDTISGLRVFPFPPLSAQPPFAFVNLPESIDYDLTMGRGADQFTLDVYLGVAANVDRASSPALCGYASGSGATSVKAVIEAAMGHSVRVTKATFSMVPLGGNSYAGLVFSVSVAQ